MRWDRGSIDYFPVRYPQFAPRVHLCAEVLSKNSTRDHVTDPFTALTHSPKSFCTFWSHMPRVVVVVAKTSCEPLPSRQSLSLAQNELAAQLN